MCIRDRYSIGVISIGFEVSFGIVAYGHLTIGTHAFGDTMLLLADVYKRQGQTDGQHRR